MHGRVPHYTQVRFTHNNLHGQDPSDCWGTITMAAAGSVEPFTKMALASFYRMQSEGATLCYIKTATTNDTSDDWQEFGDNT